MKNILILLLISSCASLFKSVSYSPENSYPKASKENAMVYFMRPDSFSGSSAKWIVTETRAGVSRNIGIFTSGSYFYQEFTPGESKFEVVDPGWGTYLGEKNIRLEKGKTYYLSLVTDGDGFGKNRQMRSGLIENKSINLRDELESMRMVDLAASRESWQQ